MVGILWATDVSPCENNVAMTSNSTGQLTCILLDWPAEGDKQPDADPMDQQGHGTHVAGIVAGLSDQLVAPHPHRLKIASYGISS